MLRKTLALVAAWTGFAACSTAAAQTPATGPAAGELVFEVVEVEGKVRVSDTGVDPMKNEGWEPVKVGYHLRAGKQIFVPMRGAAKLVARPAEPPTVMAIESMTLINFSDLAIREGAQRSRMQLAYGAVKAGVAEGATRSDMEIQAPTATLSKRGTDIFRFEYADGRFTISLSEQGRGMLQALIAQSSGAAAQMLRSRLITPGQLITHSMMRAIDNLQFDRTVNVNDVFGLGNSDALFTMFNDRGFAFLLPQGANPANILDTPFGSQMTGPPPFDPDAPDGTLQEQILLNQAPTVGVRPNPGGDFGIGQGRLPGIIPTRKGVNVIRYRLYGRR